MARRPAAAASVVAIAPRAFAFSDIVDSTSLADRFGDRRFAHLIRQHNARLRAELAARGGSEAHFLGDGFMVVFASAAVAIDWAVAAQRAVADLPLHVRIGAHAGVAVREEGSYVGRDVIVARRLCEHAEAGEILVSTRLRDLAGAARGCEQPRDITLKGFTRVLEACAVSWR